MGGLCMEQTFDLQAPYEPAGDQIEAIKELVEGVNEGKRYQTLLGATGTGKTYTISNVIQQINKPTLVMAHNKTLAGQLYNEFKEFFQTMRSSTSLVTMIIFNQKHMFHQPIHL